MTRTTFLNIVSNYPDNVHVLSFSKVKGNPPYGFAIYLLRNGELHALQLTSEFSYDTPDSAVENGHKLCRSLTLIDE